MMNRKKLTDRVNAALSARPTEIPTPVTDSFSRSASEYGAFGAFIERGLVVHTAAPDLCGQWRQSAFPSANAGRHPDAQAPRAP